MERKPLAKRVVTALSNFTDDAHLVINSTQKRVTDGKRVERVGKTSDTSQALDFSTEGVRVDAKTSSSLKQNLLSSTGNGGQRVGGGRPKGSINKKTQELVAQVLSSGMTPLEYLLNEMRDVLNTPEVRRDCAKSAAPYLHPRLNSTELSGKNGKPIPLAAVNIPTDPQAAADLYKTLMG